MLLTDCMVLEIFKEIADNIVYTMDLLGSLTVEGEHKEMLDVSKVMMSLKSTYKYKSQNCL